MRPEDLATASALGIRSKASWGYAPSAMAIFRRELTLDADALRACLAAKVAIRENKMAGYFTLKSSGSTAVELEHMFVDPDFFRSGIGTQLFRLAVGVAREHKATEIQLISDPNAVGFYQKMGARITAEHQSSIADRRIPVMTFTIPTP